VEGSGRSTAFAQMYFPVWALRDRIDIFWSPRHQLPLLLPPRSRKVLTVHDVVWKRIPETMPREAVALEALLMPMSLRLADQVITDSHFSRSEIVSYFPKASKKLDVVYLASNLKADGPAAACPLDRPFFLTVGSYEPRKNMERMLHAYIQYRQLTADPVDLVIVGTEQWGKFSARDFVRTRNLESCVHLMQRAEDAVLRALYANARALVLVSLYEGFGLPLVEAMQWGIPILTSNTSSLTEIAGDAAMLVNPLDTDAIAQGMKRISEDEPTRRELARRGQTRAKEFSWSRAAAETMALLLGDLAVAGADTGQLERGREGASFNI